MIGIRAFVFIVTCCISASQVMAMSGRSSGEQQFPQDAEGHNFKCGKTLVTFLPHSGDVASFRVGSTTYLLKQAISASGARYLAEGDPETEFWTKGDKAWVTIAGKKLPECHLVEKAQEKVESPDGVQDFEWTLVDINGKTVQGDPRLAATKRSKITLQFDARSDRFSGNSGCNRYSGSYTLKEADLKINPQIVSTRMACLNRDLARQEQEYLSILPQITHIQRDETGTLTLTGSGHILKYRLL